MHLLDPFYSQKEYFVDALGLKKNLRWRTKYKVVKD